MKRAVLLALVCLVPLGTLRAVDTVPAQNTAARSRGGLVPLRVEVTPTRSEGARKLDGRSYVMWVNADDGPSTLKAGVEVPVAVTTFTRDGGSGAPATSYQYRNVGVNLKCSAKSLADGHYKLDLEFEQSSPGPAGQGQGDMPRFRTSAGHFKMVLRDGQEAEAAVAVDPSTGEGLRVETTLKVVD
jgi:Bacterial type II and III secretion system protein